MFSIRVYTQEKTLYFTGVKKYLIDKGRCTFIDEKTKTLKDFPQEKCDIEEMNRGGGWE